MDKVSGAVPFVMVTPARNESELIEKTIASVICQTSLPLKWVIVDDGSTDNTLEIIERYAIQHPWIEVVQASAFRARSFAAKVGAFNLGYEKVKDLNYEIVVNIDADVSFRPGLLRVRLKQVQRRSESRCRGNRV